MLARYNSLETSEPSQALQSKVPGGGPKLRKSPTSGLERVQKLFAKPREQESPKSKGVFGTVRTLFCAIPCNPFLQRCKRLFALWAQPTFSWWEFRPRKKEISPPPRRHPPNPCAPHPAPSPWKTPPPSVSKSKDPLPHSPQTPPPCPHPPEIEEKKKLNISETSAKLCTSQPLLSLKTVTSLNKEARLLKFHFS